LHLTPTSPRLRVTKCRHEVAGLVTEQFLALIQRPDLLAEAGMDALDQLRDGLRLVAGGLERCVDAKSVGHQVEVILKRTNVWFMVLPIHGEVARSAGGAGLGGLARLTRYPDMKDEIKGKADELKGRLTGDKSEELKGKAEQAADKVKRTGRDIRDDVKEQSDEERDREAREREAESVTEKRSW